VSALCACCRWSLLFVAGGAESNPGTASHRDQLERRDWATGSRNLQIAHFHTLGSLPPWRRISTTSRSHSQQRSRCQRPLGSIVSVVNPPMLTNRKSRRSKRRATHEVRCSDEYVGQYVYVELRWIFLSCSQQIGILFLDIINLVELRWTFLSCAILSQISFRHYSICVP